MAARIIASARSREGVEGVRDGRIAILIEQLGQAPLAEIQRVELAVEIAVVRHRHAGIG